MQMNWSIRFKRQSNQIQVALEEYRNGVYYDTLVSKSQWIPPWRRSAKGLERAIKRLQRQIGEQYWRNKAWWSTVYSFLNNIHTINSKDKNNPPKLRIIKKSSEEDV